MSFDDLMKLWKTNPAMAQTVNDKARMGKALRSIIAEAQELLLTVERIPVEDDKNHSDLVHDLTEDIEDISKRISTCYGKHAYKHS